MFCFVLYVGTDLFSYVCSLQRVYDVFPYYFNLLKSFEHTTGCS